jgi:hypothetical protein
MTETITVPDLSRLPWVRAQREPVACAARVISHRGCRNTARWNYTFLPSVGDPADLYDGQTVPFCAIHLLSWAVQEGREQKRCRRWFEANR